MISWVSVVMLCVVVAVQITGILDIPIGSLVGPAAVIGGAIGFGAQKLVQDLLSGFFIITERQYGFGDLVQLSMIGASVEALGTVEDVTLRVTKLRTADGEVFTVPNGNIVRSLNLSKDWARAVVDIPVPTSADLNRVNEVLHQVCENAMEADAPLRDLLLDTPSIMGWRASNSVSSICGWWLARCPANSSRWDAGCASRWCGRSRRPVSSLPVRCNRWRPVTAGRSDPQPAQPNGRRWRWPAQLFNGRVRTSTVLLIIAFVAVWWVYDTYRPQPTPPVAPQVVPPGFIPDPAYTWVPRTRSSNPRPRSARPRRRRPPRRPARPNRRPRHRCPASRSVRRCVRRRRRLRRRRLRRSYPVRARYRGHLRRRACPRPRLRPGR